MSRRKLAFLLLPVLALWLVAGCAHYQLGTGSAPAFRTLYVEAVANQTLLPQSRALVSTQLREALLRDGRISLVNSAREADATLTVVITEYRRDVRAVREDDTGLARKLDLTLGATCTLRDQRGSKTIFEHRVIEARREAFTDGGQLQSEYQALPLLAETLAGKIARATLDVW